MSETFTYDLFLSHSSKDKPVVRPIAERLRADGLNVWFDEWEIRTGDSIPAKIEEGLEHSRVLVLCMSANAFGSDWTQLESGTFRFRDPLNKGRRFIPLRLDEAPIKGSLGQYLYIKWGAAEQEYAKLLEACSPPAVPSLAEVAPPKRKAAGKRVAAQTLRLAYANASILDYAFTSDGRRALTASEDKTVRMWELATGRCLGVFKGHTKPVSAVDWSADQRSALSGSDDKTIRLWDAETGLCLRVLAGHTGPI